MNRLSSEVFTELDRVMSLELMQKLNLQPAQIVSIGMESHGKSTLLERLIGIPLFPRDKSLCTRSVVRVQLRRRLFSPATICIRDRTSRKLVPDTHVKFIAVERISEEVKHHMDMILEKEPGNLISITREVVVTINAPFVPNLDLLDLPGIVSLNPSIDGVKQDVALATEQLAESILKAEKQHSIFLLVVDVRSNINHSRAVELIRRNALQQQTIGVFTKLDCYQTEDDRDDSAVWDKLHDRSLLVEHGWLLTASRRPMKDFERALDRLATMDEQEERLLQREEYHRYTELNRCGILIVRQVVQNLFEDFLCQAWIPSIIAALKEEFRVQFRAGAELGLPLPPQNGMYNDMVKKLNASYRLFVENECSDDPALMESSQKELLSLIDNETLKVIMRKKVQRSLSDRAFLKYHGSATMISTTMKEYNETVIKFNTGSWRSENRLEVKTQLIQIIMRLIDEVISFAKSTLFHSKVSDAAFEAQSFIAVKDVALPFQEVLFEGSHLQLKNFDYFRSYFNAFTERIFDSLAIEFQNKANQLVHDLADATHGLMISQFEFTEDGVAAQFKLPEACIHLHSAVFELWLQLLRRTAMRVEKEDIPGDVLIEGCEELRIANLDAQAAIVDVMCRLRQIKNVRKVDGSFSAIVAVIPAPKVVAVKGFCECGQELVKNHMSLAANQCVCCNLNRASSYYYRCQNNCPITPRVCLSCVSWCGPAGQTEKLLDSLFDSK